MLTVKFYTGYVGARRISDWKEVATWEKVSHYPKVDEYFALTEEDAYRVHRVLWVNSGEVEVYLVDVNDYGIHHG